MNFNITSTWLKQQFDVALNYEQLAVELSLDMGHLMMLKDVMHEQQEVPKEIILVMFYLIHTVNSGSLCLYLNDASFEKFLAQHDGASSTIEKFSWQQLKIDHQAVFVLEDNRLYFSKYWHYEKALGQVIERLVNDYRGQMFNAAEVNQVAHQVISDLKFESIENKQILAVVTSLLKPFSIISGGPGTGKTTIMGSVLRGLLALGYTADEIKLAAPTGRAANRMTESLQAMINVSLKHHNARDSSLSQLEATTIHRLLKVKPNAGQFTYGANNQLPCQVLVIDEVSMVDIKLMKQLMQAVPNDCRVILLGDQFQLPSVSAGAVLADLMPPEQAEVGVSRHMYTDLTDALHGFEQKKSLLSQLKVTEKPQLLSDCYTLLEVSKRSRQNIARCSELIRKGCAEELLSSPDWQQLQFTSAQDMSEADGVFHLPQFRERSQWHQFYSHWMKSHYFTESQTFINNINYLEGFDEHTINTYQNHLREVFAVVNNNRMLTFVNQGIVGCDAMNEQVVAMMKQQLGVKGFANQFHGSVIMVTRNNANLGLFNGDVGILLQASGGQLRAVFPTKGRFISHSIHVIPEFKSAYAMTVHKSQGSEFNHVLIPMPDDINHRLLSREILYTGLTRAKQSAIIYGSELVIKAAIKTKTQRHSGLRFWYN